MVRDTVRYKQFGTKTIPKHELQDIHCSKTSKFPGCRPFKILYKNLRFGASFRGFLGRTLGPASDDERSMSFKMVRDTARFKQFGTKTIPNTSFER